VALIVYYSSKTGNTHHFVNQLDVALFRIDKTCPQTHVDSPFVLVLPTYAGGDGRGAVPKAVIHFLNEEHNRQFIRGVIAGGNRNFGWTYGLAGTVIAQKCHVPQLYRFELRGTDDDIMRVRSGLERFWKQH